HAERDAFTATGRRSARNLPDAVQPHRGRDAARRHRGHADRETPVAVQAADRTGRTAVPRALAARARALGRAAGDAADEGAGQWCAADGTGCTIDRDGT